VPPLLAVPSATTLFGGLLVVGWSAAKAARPARVDAQPKFRPCHELWPFHGCGCCDVTQPPCRVRPSGATCTQSRWPLTTHDIPRPAPPRREPCTSRLLGQDSNANSARAATHRPCVATLPSRRNAGHQEYMSVSQRRHSSRSNQLPAVNQSPLWGCLF